MADVKKGTVQGEIMDPDDAAQYESKEVISKVDERLAELTGNPAPVVKKPVETEEEDDDASDLTPEDKDTDVVDDADDTADDTDGDAIDGDDTKEGEDKDDEKAIPEQLFRAAIHSGRTPEEITEFWKKDPEFAKKMLEKIHTDMVNTNTVYAEQGRATKELQKQRDKLENQKVDPVIPAKRRDFVDIEAAREEFGDGAANIIKQLNDALVKVTTTQEQAPRQQDAIQHETDLTRHERSMAAIQQYAYFFADDNMKLYEEFYGAGRDSNGLPLITSDHLTLDQRKNRSAVMNIADDIEAGIQIRGGTTSISDTLSRAHVIVTKDIQTKVIRDSILRQGKKRSKGVTLRPSSKKIEQKVKLKQGEHKEEKQIYSDADLRLKRLIAGKPMR